MPTTTASMYDPAQGGINGNPNAVPCRVPVSQLPWSVAHKTAPCGTIVTIIGPDNKTIVQAPVADRGPYIAGRDLDLRPAVAQALGSTGLVKVRYSLGVHRVDLHKMAAAGGDAAAFEKVSGKVASSNDALAKKTDEQAATEADANKLVNKGIPGLSELAQVSGAIASIGEVFGKLFANLGDPQFWLRTGQILFGGILILIALDKLTGGAISAPARMAGKAAAVVK